MELLSYNIFTVLIVGAIIIQYSKSAVADDVGTNFFLKASKSVPRIGRRSMDYENYFLKASKSVPRIGRRRTINPSGDVVPSSTWYRAVKVAPNLEKRAFSDKYLTETGQPIWQRIEKAYEEYPALLQSDEPYRESRADSDPEYYWQRMKKDMEEDPGNASD